MPRIRQRSRAQALLLLSETWPVHSRVSFFENRRDRKCATAHQAANQTTKTTPQPSGDGNDQPPDAAVASNGIPSASNGISGRYTVPAAAGARREKCHDCLRRPTFQIPRKAKKRPFFRRVNRGLSPMSQCPSGIITGVRVDGWVGLLFTHSVSTYVGHEPFSLWKKPRTQCDAEY